MPRIYKNQCVLREPNTGKSIPVEATKVGYTVYTKNANVELGILLGINSKNNCIQVQSKTGKIISLFPQGWCREKKSKVNFTLMIF